MTALSLAARPTGNRLAAAPTPKRRPARCRYPKVRNWSASPANIAQESTSFTLTEQPVRRWPTTAPALESSPAKPYRPPSPGSSTRRATNASGSGTWSKTSSPVAWPSSPAKPAADPHQDADSGYLLRPNLPDKSPEFGTQQAGSPKPAAFHTPTSETPAASRRRSRRGSSVPAYSGGSDAAIADGVDARNVLPLPPIGGEARLPQPVATKSRSASAKPAALSSPAPAPAKPPYP